MTLARLLRPQGRHGELLADLLTDFPELLSSISGVYLVSESATEPSPSDQRIRVDSQWMPTGRNAGRIVLKLAGCDSITAAESLARKKLIIPADERPSLDEDTFYISDLVGCQLFDNTSEVETLVGEVIDVEFATTPDGKTRLADAAPLLVVQLAGDTEDDDPALIPFVNAHLVSVDTAAHRITMTIPAGLIEAEEDGIDDEPAF